jgi:hypothetical protein
MAGSTSYRGLRVHNSRLRPNQILVSYTLARSAKLSRLSSNSLKLPPQVEFVLPISKGRRHEMNNYLKAYTIKSVLVFVS